MAGESVADMLKTALDLKEEGNKLYRAKEYRQAMSKYGKIPLYIAHYDCGAIQPPPEPEPNPDGTPGEPLPPPPVMEGPVGPQYPTPEQKKQLRELRITAALNTVQCYVKMVDADTAMANAETKEKEQELKTLMGKAMDQINKAANLDYLHKKVMFRRAQVHLRLGSVDAAQRDLEAAKSGFKKDDPEVAREYALLESRNKQQADKQKKTFSGWLNKVSKGGGLISEDDLKAERAKEEEEKRAKREWEYKQKEESHRGRGMPGMGGGFGGMGQGMQMMMVKLNSDMKKEQVEYTVYKWTEHFKSNPYEKVIPVQFYPLEGTKLLISLEGDYVDIFKVKDFVLAQDETEEFEWQQAKFYPKGKDPNPSRPNGGGFTADNLKAMLEHTRGGTSVRSKKPKDPNRLRRPKRDRAAAMKAREKAVADATEAAKQAPGSSLTTKYSQWDHKLDDFNPDDYTDSSDDDQQPTTTTTAAAAAAAKPATATATASATTASASTATAAAPAAAPASAAAADAKAPVAASASNAATATTAPAAAAVTPAPAAAAAPAATAATPVAAAAGK